MLAIEAAVARDLDRQLVRQRVDHRDADPVQTARGLVGIAAELAARVQRRQDDFQRRFVGEARMGVDRNAAAVVVHRDPAFAAQLDLDPARVAGDRLVHRVVERLGGEVVQRPLIGAADIHARPAPYRLEPLEHLYVLGGIAVIELRRQIVEKIRHWRRIIRGLESRASRMQYVRQPLVTISS
jgi:hypothetical protein